MARLVAILKMAYVNSV